MLRKSLHDAWSEMERLQGPDPAKWSWGGLHKVKFRHPLDQIPDAAAVMDLGPVARPGDEYTVNATGYPEDSFDQVSGASYREILDLADWDHSVAVNVPGQSGQPGSPHYSDLLSLWSEGKYFPLVYSREAVEREVTDRLVLGTVKQFPVSSFRFSVLSFPTAVTAKLSGGRGSRCGWFRRDSAIARHPGAMQSRCRQSPVPAKLCWDTARC